MFMHPDVYLCVRSIAKILLRQANHPLPCDKRPNFTTHVKKSTSEQEALKSHSATSGCGLVIVGYVFQGVFGESVSIEALIFLSDPIDSSVERKTADIGLNYLCDSGLVFIGNIVLVGSNESVDVYPCSASCIRFVLHAHNLVPVKGHSNPLK